MITIHLVVARSSQWDQWMPVKGFVFEGDAKAFAKSIVDANNMERKCFDEMLEARLPENGWKLATEAFEELQKLHPAPDFRGSSTEFDVQLLEVVGSA